jgi:hypothetical protein
MTDLSWLAQEAHTIHAYFESLFYVFLLLLLLFGVLTQYFQWSIGGTPSFAPLVGRAFVAALLLHAYPDISNLIADIADAMAKQLGDLNQFGLVERRYAEIWDQLSWNWVSVKDGISMILTHICFYLLYFSVFISDAFFLYTWTLLYVFSPILIALYVLPVTASATSALFRSLLEVACWKIVWAVLATLLWSAGLSAVNQQGSDVPFMTVIAFDLILAGSVLLTPLVVHGLASQGLTNVSRTVGSIAIAGMTLNPLAMAKQGISAMRRPNSPVNRARNALTNGDRGNTRNKARFQNSNPKGTRTKIQR